MYFNIVLHFINMYRFSTILCQLKIKKLKIFSSTEFLSLIKTVALNITNFKDLTLCNWSIRYEAILLLHSKALLNLAPTHFRPSKGNGPHSNILPPGCSGY